MRYLHLFLILNVLFIAGKAQEVWFFSEGTGPAFYDQGIVDKNIGSSTFEYTYPPGLPQYNDKIPCSSTAFKGSTSLKFNYFSSENGNWKVSVYRSDWSAADISNLDSVSFYIYSENPVPQEALPLMGIRAARKNGSGDVNSAWYPLSEFNPAVEARKWTKIRMPLSVIFNDSSNSSLDFTAAKGILFGQSEKNNIARLVLIDEITAFKSIADIPPVSVFSVKGYDSHAELNWERPDNAVSYRIYASFDNGANFQVRGETSENFFLDFVPAEGKNKTVIYRIVSLYQGKESAPNEKPALIRDFSDDELLDLVEEYAFRYFWEGAHQATGMALERSNGNGRTAASGATGMGLMSMIAAHEREYRPREEIKDRILKILDFLEKCDRHHGAWSHWYNADTYKTQPFSEFDDGGDIVETSYVVQGLIALKNYFSGSDEKSVLIREKADKLWKEVDWDWYRLGGQNVLYWHWSPNYGFKMNMKVRGWNECLVTYIMAASSPAHPVPEEVYVQGWAQNGSIVRRRSYYNYEINLSPDWGGPLFWIHYSHLGINPNGLKDRYADYWQEHVNTARIHFEYAKANPLSHTNYSEKCWGLTASDDPYGYTAHRPMSNDNGTISPTAALASFPYTPEESMKALKYFYRERGADIFGIYGPYDAFNDDLGWVKKAYLGIDQGPIAVMIENYRTGLLWKMLMRDADVQAGLEKLGFNYLTSVQTERAESEFSVYPNPAGESFSLRLSPAFQNKKIRLQLFSIDGKPVLREEFIAGNPTRKIDCRLLENGMYILQLSGNNAIWSEKVLIRKNMK